jgi:hypothetical protein
MSWKTSKGFGWGGRFRIMAGFIPGLPVKWNFDGLSPVTDHFQTSFFVIFYSCGAVSSVSLEYELSSALLSTFSELSVSLSLSQLSHIQVWIGCNGWLRVTNRWQGYANQPDSYFCAISLASHKSPWPIDKARTELVLLLALFLSLQRAAIEVSHTRTSTTWSVAIRDAIGKSVAHRESASSS